MKSQASYQSKLMSRLVLLSTVCKCLNPIALRMAKTLWSFGLSECNRVKDFSPDASHIVFNNHCNQKFCTIT